MDLMRERDQVVAERLHRLAPSEVYQLGTPVLLRANFVSNLSDALFVGVR